MKRLFWLSCVTAAVSLLLMSGAVYAAGEEPPAAEPDCADCAEADVIEIPSGDPATVENPPAIELQESGTGGENPATSDDEAAEPVGEVIAEETAPGEDQNLEVVVLNAQGEAQDMASQESAEVLLSPDPYFSVGTTRYRFFSQPDVCASQYPGDPFCFDGKGDDVIQDVITYISTEGAIPTDQKIYIESGIYGNADITIDGANPNLSTINGLIGVNLDGTNPIINGNVYITSLTGGFTLKGFTINGAVSILNSPGSIVLEDLEVTNSAGSGVEINGPGSPHFGTMMVKDVNSHHNSGHGAAIYTVGNISVANSSFTINGGDGLLLETSAGTISIQGTTANGNTGAGIRSEEFKKGITLKQVLANDNDSGGISLLKGAGSILFEDVEACSSESGTGVVIGEKINPLNMTPHKGSVTLKNVRVNDNTNSTGATVIATGNIVITNSSFDHNGGVAGLWVESSAGTITIKGITASRNDARGIYNLNAFTKTFTLQHVQANDNGLYGIDVGLAHPSVGAPTGAFIADTVYAQNNHQALTPIVDIKGFKVTTYGAITLKNILVENTANGYGLVLIHDSATPVVLQNVTSRDNDKNGIDIGSRGNVSLTSVKSTGNKGDGARITNWGSEGIGTITITSPASAGTAGANDFSDNGGYGLFLASNSTITLSNLDASRNGLDGLWVDTAGNLTFSRTLPNWINGFNGKSEGAGNGIFLRVDGNVILGYCEASDNAKSGVNFNSAAKSATVTGGKFDNNGEYGLYINVSGNVVLANIESASNNDWDDSDTNTFEGIKIENALNVTLKNSSKTASTAIGGNSGNGLSIYGTGSVAITGLNAWSNGGHGVYISNRVWPYGKPVTLIRIETGDNSGHGVYVSTAGGVSMQDIFTVENTSHGMEIDACVFDPNGCLNLANVTLKGSNNAFSNNEGAGLVISTKGSINLSHLDVYGNDAGGVKIFNALNGTSPVTIGGKTSSKIDTNTGYGLWVESHGAITLKNLTVQNTSDFDSNVYGAIYLTNKGPARKGVTLTDVNINTNEQNGLYINTDGPVSLLGVTSNDNSITSGLIDEDNSTNGVRERLTGSWENNADRWHFVGEPGDTYTITLTSSAFKPILALEDEYGVERFIDLNPDGDGTAVLSFGLITGGEYILRVEAAGWGMGLYELTFGGLIRDFNIHGAYISTPASVKVSSSKAIFSSFNGNNGDGLYINVDSSGIGTVSLVNVGAENNSINGINVSAPVGNVSLGNSHARVSSFSGNGLNGVQIFSGGTITLNNRLTAWGNGREGFYLDNHEALTPKAITIRNVQTWFNSGTGLTARSLGNISVTNLDASANIHNGAVLNTLGNVALLGSNVFSGNDEQGLNVTASGTVSITGVLAEGNQLNGLDIQSSGVGKTVLVKNTILRFNQDTGLNVDAQGAITLDNVQSVLNFGSGVDIQPNGISTIIKNSVMMGNGANGLRVEVGMYTLINSLYYGNVSQNIYLYYPD